MSITRHPNDGRGNSPAPATGTTPLSALSALAVAVAVAAVAGYGTRDLGDRGDDLLRGDRALHAAGIAAVAAELARLPTGAWARLVTANEGFSEVPVQRAPRDLEQHWRLV